MEITFLEVSDNLTHFDLKMEQQITKQKEAKFNTHNVTMLIFKVTKNKIYIFSH